MPPPTDQLPLPFPHERPRHLRPRDEARDLAQSLADDLQHRLQRRIRLAVTDNRSSLLTIREKGPHLDIRLHHMFLDADADVRQALADWAAGRREKTSGRLIDDFIAANEHRIRRAATSPAAPVDPQGEHHDLQSVFDRINREHFGGRVVARIGWGRWGKRRRRRRSIKMGTYHHDARLIRIHPALDRVEVPDYYVAWVVFHEMLHQVVPPVRRGGRTYYHPPAFRTLERAFPDAGRARAWEEKHFELLLR